MYMCVCLCLIDVQVFTGKSADNETFYRSLNDQLVCVSEESLKYESCRFVVIHRIGRDYLQLY